MIDSFIGKAPKTHFPLFVHHRPQCPIKMQYFLMHTPTRYLRDLRDTLSRRVHSQSFMAHHGNQSEEEKKSAEKNVCFAFCYQSIGASPQRTALRRNISLPLRKNPTDPHFSRKSHTAHPKNPTKEQPLKQNICVIYLTFTPNSRHISLFSNAEIGVKIQRDGF